MKEHKRSGHRCPRCYSTNWYIGTQTVRRQLGSYGHLDENTGAYYNMPVSHTHEKTVCRCKECDTALGKKDGYGDWGNSESNKVFGITLPDQFFGKVLFAGVLAYLGWFIYECTQDQALMKMIAD